MNSASRITLASLALGFLIGCGSTTGDPSSGGYFGWSEDKAKQRQEEMRQQYEAEQASLYMVETDKQRLELNRITREGDLEELRKYNDFLKADVVTRTSLLESMQQLDAAKKSDLSRLKSELNALGGPNTDQKQLSEELLRLREQIDAIERSAHK